MNTEFNNQQQEIVDSYTAQPERPQKTGLRSKTIVILAVVFCTMALALGGIGYTLYANYQNNVTCTVGVSGYSVNLTFKGWGAGDLCEQAQAKPASNGIKFYHLDEPQGVIMCAGDHPYKKYNSTIHYTVRDTSAGEIFGSALCQKMISTNF